MKNLKIKKTKMICSVKGCSERATFFISKAGDFAGTPNICLDCLKKAYELAAASEDAPKNEVPKTEEASKGEDASKEAPSAGETSGAEPVSLAEEASKKVNKAGKKASGKKPAAKKGAK